jgi:endonuclease/exonuclease/phosphatase family metal-dependent hydrolase
MSAGTEPAVVWRVLTWNLKHGRAVPPAGRDLLAEFTAALRGWEWDLALLQEVPPWWPQRLAAALEAEQRLALTSRNAGLALRRAIAVRWPDLIKSNGGGCNAILVRRGLGAISAHRTRRLCLLPERRWVHGVRLAGTWGDAWICNLHTAANADQGRLAATTAQSWAGGAPVVLGGDFNVRSLSLEGFEHAAGHDVDHVYAAGVEVVPGSARTLKRGELSDHAPVAVSLASALRPAEHPAHEPAR